MGRYNGKIGLWSYRARTIPALLLIAILFLIPMAFVFSSAIREGTLAEALDEGATYRILLFTIEEAFLSALVSTLLAIPFAAFFASYRFPGRRAILALSGLSFTMPAILVVLGFVIWYGNNGYLNTMLSQIIGQGYRPFRILYTFPAIIIAHAYLNFPIAFQFPGRYNPCSLDEKELDSAIAYAKQHISYAAAAGSRIIAITSGPDYLPEKREMEYASFREYLKALSTECRKYGIEIALETVERHRFKKLLLGPSSEAGSFIREIRQEGYDNVFLMVDTAHCPLMEETPADVLHNSLLAGVNHVHIGNAIVGNEANPMYGHTHPPIGIQDGSYDVDDIAHFLRLLFDCGYLSINPEHDKRPCISYEIRQYPGTSYFSTAMICYEKMDAAFRKAVSS